MSRHPYTHAADYVRSLPETGISRSDACAIRQGIAKAIGMNDEELATKLADYFRANEESITEAGVRKLLGVEHQ